MKRLLLPLLASLALPTAVNANWFSGDIVETNSIGEKTIIKKSTVIVSEPTTVNDYFGLLKSNLSFSEKMKKKAQDYFDKWERKYADCLATEKQSYCDVVGRYPKLLSERKKDVDKYNKWVIKDKDRIIRLTPKFKKFNGNEITQIRINYTPIIEDINGKKFVQKKAEVKCQNKFIDFSSIEIKQKYLNLLEKKICKKYAKF